MLSSYRHYYIVVSLRLLEDTKAIEESELLSAIEAKANDVYITASVDYVNFSPYFTIGDGSNSTDSITKRTFYNAPLWKQQEYYYFVRAYSKAHGDCIDVSYLDVFMM